MPVMQTLSYKRHIMIKDISFTIWMVLLLGFLIALSSWAIFFVDKVEYQIPIFGIVGAIMTAITTVLSVTLNNKKIKEREFELLVAKEKQKVFEHFYNAYFEMLKLSQIKNKSQASKLSKNAESEMMEFKRGLMNWGSEEIINDYLEYESKLTRSRDEGSKFDMLTDGNKFLHDIRRELGFIGSGKVNIMSIILTVEAREELNLNQK
jgi:uncharacterized membrane protein